MVYHINGKGELSICRAQPENCPFKDSPHGTPSEVEAELQARYELAPSRQRLKLPPSEQLPESWIKEEIDYWKSVEEKLGLLVHQGIPYPLGDPSKSVFFCLECNTQLPKSADYRTPSWSKRCPSCGNSCTDGLVGNTLKPGAERFFDKDEVLKSDWYHHTSHEEWGSFLHPEAVDSRVVHLGTRDAAIDRRTQTRSAEKSRIYRLRLKPGSEVADNILQEDPFNMERAPLVADGGITRGILVNGVTRYMNSYEDPGSFSIIVDPRLLEIVDFTDFSSNS